MVIVKSKIDFATSMRRIFSKYGRKNFRFSVQKAEKSGEKFSLQSVYLFLSQKGRRLRKKDGLENKGKFFPSFQEMGLPGRLWISDASYQSFLPARSIQGSFIFAVKSLQRNPWICTFLPCQNVVAPARMLYWATLRGMPLTEKQFMRAGCPMRIRPSKHPTIMAFIKILRF